MPGGSSHPSAYALFIAAVVCFSVALVCTYMGKARSRFYGWVYRTEEPNRFWQEVLGYYLMGAILMGMCLYQAYRR